MSSIPTKDTVIIVVIYAQATGPYSFRTTEYRVLGADIAITRLLLVIRLVPAFKRATARFSGLKISTIPSHDKWNSC